MTKQSDRVGRDTDIIEAFRRLELEYYARKVTLISLLAKRWGITTRHVRRIIEKEVD